MIQVTILSEEEIKKIAELQAVTVGATIEGWLQQLEKNQTFQIQQLKQDLYEVSSRLDRFLEKQ